MKRFIFNINKTHAGMAIHIMVLAIMVMVSAAGPAYAQIQGLPGLSGGQSGSRSGPASGGSMGAFTSPVSSRSRSLIPSPQYNPNYGNMLVTGNVGGGREFRGVVPYTAPRDYRAILPSTSTDDFLRYSTSANQPFYSRTRSPLGTTDVGTLPITRQPSEKVRSSEGSETFLYSPFQITTPQTVASVAGAEPVNRYSYQNTLLERVQGYKPVQRYIPIGVSMEQILPSDKIIVPLQPQEFTADQTKVDIDILKPFEMPASANKTVTAVQPSMETNAELENIRKMIKEQQDREEANKLIKKAISYKWQAQLKEAEKPVGLKSYKQRTAEGETSSGLTAEPTTKTAATGGGAAEQPRKFAQDSNIYDHEFNEKMAQAQKLMEEGKFYQAVDAYTYATLYKPLEPSGYVGKSLAFLAAGEYLSSAQLLSAGLKLSADYAKVKQDLSKLITDKDKFQVRFRDLDKSAAENLKPELLYLLAYTCFQTDQIAKAQQAIDIAAKAMPYDKAISDLKKIIDESRSTR